MVLSIENELGPEGLRVIHDTLIHPDGPKDLRTLEVGMTLVVASWMMYWSGGECLYVVCQFATAILINVILDAFSGSPAC